MSFRRGRTALLYTGMLLPLFAACTAAQAGAPAPAAPTAARGLTSPAVTSPAVPAPAASAAAPDASAGPSPDPSGPAAAPGDWNSALIEFGGAGFPSPSGDLNAVVRDGHICFESATGGGPCAALAAGDQPVFLAFSPDGRRLLVVAGPDDRSRTVYVLDTGDARMRVIGPAGVTDEVAAPARWHLSTAAWSGDGSAVVLVPHTDGDTGPVLSADLADGTVTETLRLPADLANGRPAIRPTRDGTALVGSTGADRQTLWWSDGSGGEVRQIARFGEAGGSLTIAAADPLGRTVLVCPRRSDGRWGATVGIAVRTGESARLITDSTSCAGAVFSADGQHVALTATFDSGYRMIVVDLTTGRRVLTVPLAVAEPLSPPYLTWLGDTVVISDLSGEWRNSSLVVRLR